MKWDSQSWNEDRVSDEAQRVGLEVFFSEKMKAKYAEEQGLCLKFSDKHTAE